eukprot:552939_1
MTMSKSILLLILLLIKQYNCWIDCSDSKCKVPDEPLPSSIPGSKVGNSVFRQTQYTENKRMGSKTISNKVTKCSAVVKWSEGLHHHQVDSACSKLGPGFWFASEYMIEDTITDTYAAGQGTATDCYTKDTYYWVGPHNAVKKAKDWDDKGGKIICACDYVSIKDDTGGLATGDTTCYAKDGYGVAYNIECADGCFMCVDEGKCKCKESQAKKKNSCFVCYGVYRTDVENDYLECGWSIGANAINYPSLDEYPNTDSHYPDLYINGFIAFVMISVLINLICCGRVCVRKNQVKYSNLKDEEDEEEEEENNPLNV